MRGHAFCTAPGVPEKGARKFAPKAHRLACGQSVGRVKTTHTEMGWIRAWLVGAMALVGSVTALSAAGQWATLEAIHCLENPRDLTRPGPKGELGAYQFREPTWRMHTAVPFAQAVDRRESDTVAALHYAWLCRGLTRAGLAATPYRIALAWNGGLTAAVKGRAPRVAHDYAQRAENLAAEFERGADVQSMGPGAGR